MMDYYELLQVHPKASPEIIKKAYRTLMLELDGHPDRGGTARQAGLLNEAYAVLSDPGKRREYDRSRAGGRVGGSRSLDVVIVPCPACSTKNRVKSLAMLKFAKCSRCGAHLTPSSDGGRSRDWMQAVWDALPQRTCPSCQHRTRLTERRCPQCGQSFRPKGLPADLHRKPVLWFTVAGAAAAMLLYLYWPAVSGLAAKVPILPGAADEPRRAAIQLTADGHTDGAIRAWREWLDGHPEDSEAAASLGKLLLKEEKPAEAAQYLTKAIQSEPDKAAWHFSLAGAYHQLGRRTEAIRHFRRATELDPTAGAAWYNLGYLLQLDGENDGALMAYRRAAELEPERAEALINLGALLAKQAKYDEAAKVLDEAVRRQAKDPEAHYNLGVVYSKMARTEQAMGHLARAVELYMANGQPKKAATIQERLDQLALPEL